MMGTMWYQRYTSVQNLTKICFIGFLCCIAALSGCKDDPAGAKESASTKIPINVTTLTIHADEALRTVTLSGFTEPVHRATPAARIMAKVVEVGFQEGDWVESDQLLIRLDTRDLLANKRQAEAAYNTASTTLDIAQKNLKRMTTLYASQTVSRHQMENAQVGEAQETAARQAAKSAIEQIDVNLSYSVVRAPFKGIVVRKMVETGNMVAPGQGLFIIEDDSRLRVIAPLGTDLAANLNTGQKLPVGMGHETVEGVIEGIVSSGSTEAPGQRVQLLIDNRDRRFRVGTLAVVEIPQANFKTTGIFVPKAALIEKGRLTGAFVVAQDKTARLHWLITGEDRGDSISVISGLQAGDRIILSPESTKVKDGSAVKETVR
jgi:RND family efflux transporter MFP subunit